MFIITVEILARDLAKGLKATREYADLKAAQARTQLEPPARNLISNLEKTHQIIMEAELAGQPVETTMYELQVLQQKALQNPTLRLLFQAQQAFSMVMEEINFIITDELGRQ